MTTAAIISDVHGNSLALRAVLDDIRGRHVDATYCLGDLVGYGPDPNGVIDLIRAESIPTILGNYDEGVAWETGDCGCFYADAEAERIGEASYAFTVAAVTTERKAYPRTPPRELHVAFADKEIHLAHGSPRRINEYLSRDRDERTYRRLAESESDDVLAFGHTHDPWFRSYGKTLFVTHSLWSFGHVLVTSRQRNAPSYGSSSHSFCAQHHPKAEVAAPPVAEVSRQLGNRTG